ncbi:polysaccharide biosynthesis tyrosine autokinase [bacterium]|nr:polysaccharide biosynthesis tyrosine autokinase [bacterium]
MNEQEREIDLLEILNLFKRHIYLFAAIIIIVMTFAAAQLYRMKKIYSSTVTIEIEPQATNVLGGDMELVKSGINAQENSISSKDYYTAQYEIIKSRAVSQKVLETIPNDKIHEYLGFDSERFPEEYNSIDPVSILQDKITVEPQKSNNIVRISVENADPEKAAFLANAVASSYIEFNLEKKYFETKDAAKWLVDQSLSLKQNLENSEMALFEFKESNNVLATTFEAKQDLLARQISKLTGILTDQEIRRNALTSKIEEYSRIDFNNPDDALFYELSKENNAIGNMMKLKYLEVISKIDESMQVYGEKHPKVVALLAEKGNIETSFRNEITGIVNSYSLSLKILDNEMKKNRRMLAETQEEATNLKKLEINYSKLRREVETNKKLYDIVLERSKKADLSALLKNNNIRIIDRALVPKVPVKPNKQTILLTGFVIALVLASLAVFLVEFFDTKFKSFKEVETISQKPVLGIIPKFQQTEDSDFKEIVFGEKSGQGLAVEAFRTLRTNIKLSNPDSKLGVMLVTSCVPHEGKTVVASNLAASYSVAGKKAIIVDADMRKPRVHEIFGLSNEKGLSTLIVGEHSMDEVIHRNVCEGLDVVTAGMIPPNPAELLESGRMADIMKCFSEKYDVVIVDSPPLTPVSDAAIIAPLTDGMIIALNIGNTPRDIFKSVVQNIVRSGISILGTVVNNIDLRQERKFKSYSGYSYYNSSYCISEEDEKIFKKKKFS